MKNEIDIIKLIVRKRFKSHRAIVFFVFIVVMLILSGSLLLIMNSKKLRQNIGKSNSNFEQKSNNVQLLDIWGTVSKVSKMKNSVLSDSAKNSKAADGAILTIQSDNGKEYQVSVNVLTNIIKNRTVGSEGEVVELVEVVDFSEIKNGDRIYLTSLIDLNSEMLVPVDKVVNIRWFETVVPK